MDSCFDATTLISSPSFANSLSWSNDNLLAVASGHIITILNPAVLDGPRGLITLKSNEPFPIGLVSKQDLMSACLMPTCLTRDMNPCVRSISWSPPGFASNSGCLLAICTFDGHVKLYRSPFCEYKSEWVEVADISQNIYEYLSKTNFGESRLEMVLVQQPGPSCTKDESGKRKRKPNNKWEINDEDKYISCTSNKIIETNNFENSNSNLTPKISPSQYSSRSAKLSCLTISWSSSFKNSNSNSNSKNCTILAIGAKSGDIYFWMIFAPKCYKTEESRVSVDSKLIGFLKAHNSWVTSINWAFFTTNLGENNLILSTGSSDGSVKLWLANVEQLSQITNLNKTPFSLLTEVAGSLSSPVSITSLIIPIKYENKVYLAIGRGSGLIETYIYDLFNNKIINTAYSDSLNQVVTGLTWAFDGQCLYSCSQESVKCWIFYENNLHEAPFSSNIPGLDNSSDLSHLTDLYFGLALSPGDMIISLVHSLDTNLLNPMYEARTQKAMVQFFYTGGQILQITKEPSNSSSNLLYWESNILFSLKKFENCEKTLVIWDIINALLVFKNSNPEFLNNLFNKWISGWFSNIQKDILLNNLLSHVIKMVSSISTRRLNILNIIIRRVIFENLKSEEDCEIWNEVLVRSEFELRERLVCLIFELVCKRVSGSCCETGLYPFQIEQMVQWVLLNNRDVSERTNKLALNIKKTLGKSLQLKTEERCNYCSARVPFESSDIAWCKDNGPHKLTRCAVSMQICNILNPAWFCICCKRSVDKLPPHSLFTMVKSLLEIEDGVFLPVCPFCGIMLQRLMPEFLLSFCPV